MSTALPVLYPQCSATFAQRPVKDAARLLMDVQVAKHFTSKRCPWALLPFDTAISTDIWQPVSASKLTSERVFTLGATQRPAARLGRGHGHGERTSHSLHREWIGGCILYIGG
jgi:hypothetical protein